MVEFKDKFTTLTGETGAGKSLIIDAIGLLFGNRSSSMMIKKGETKAIVEGVFEKVSNNTKSILEQLQIDILDGDVIVIKREISINGKNLIRVNGNIVTLTQLEKITSTLGNIHTQNDTNQLFSQSNYLTFIENNDIKSLLIEYNNLRKTYLTHLKDYQQINELSKLESSNFEFLKYQYNELTKSNLNSKEEDELTKELEYLNNFETIYKNMSSIINHFDDYNILEHLYEITNNLGNLLMYQSESQDDYNKIKDCFYELEDFLIKLKSKYNKLDFDEERLNMINERLRQLNHLKSKYKRSILDLIAFRDELRAKIQNFEQRDDKILACKNNVEKSYIDLCEISKKITEKRKDSVKKLEIEVLKTLKDLMLDKVKFIFKFDEYSLTDPYNPSSFKTNGCDKIDILISFNVGEPLKSLSKVTSGGEMSRIMLALKVHVLKTLQLSTVIFDEIDSGVSGNVANKIGEKLKEISKNTQLLAITHLLIVASYSDYQYHIHKKFNDFNTKTYIKELSYDERINYLAKMINPNDKTIKTKELVETMLTNNK